MLKRMSIPIYDAEKCIHELFKKGGGATIKIKNMFPSAIVDDVVDRKILGRLVFGKPDQLKILESIVHPLARQKRREFLALHRRRKTKRVVLDIPLLFETNSENECDYVIVASAPWFLQRRRALLWPGMNLRKLTAILQRQLPDHKKRKLCNVVIPTGLGKAYTLRKLRVWIASTKKTR